jgi:hypothetical protein
MNVTATAMAVMFASLIADWAELVRRQGGIRHSLAARRGTSPAKVEV